MTSFEIFSIFISLLAVIISAVSLVRTRKISAQQLELEKITAELSQKQLENLHLDAAVKAKAFIDVELIKSGTKYKIAITNTGGSEAQNIDFHIAEDRNPLVGNDYAEKIPIKSLKPGKAVYLLAAISSGMPASFNGCVRWKNPDGSQEKDDFILTR